MESITPYTEYFVVRSHEIDPVERITFTAFVGLLQDVATTHANLLGVGFDTLRKENFFWAISRMYYQIERLPKWREKFSITTWHKCYQGVMSIRDFLVKDESGNVIVRATSSWIIVDLDERHIKRSEQVCGDLCLHPENAIERTAMKVLVPNTLEMNKEGEIVPRFSNIDMNRHVNNVNYYTWALDYLPLDLVNTNIKSLEINFLAEAKEGVLMDICYANDSNVWYCDMKNHESGNSHCKVRLEL
ncbi:acyl-ACP thioesterase [Bacteroidia bacterium]|nr:acyl-ACP thioesterase [Bacteroidia bacterium]